MFFSKNDFSVIILAAGLSQRMGKHKALLAWDTELNFLQKIIKEYRNWGMQQIIVVTNPFVLQIIEQQSLLKAGEFVLVSNFFPEKGRLFSVQLGAAQVKTPFTFIQNVDNPFVNQQIISFLADNARPGKVVVPSFLGKGGHPVLLNSDIVQKIKALTDMNLTLHDILEPSERVKIEMPTDEVIRNINTQMEYQRFFMKIP
jgi:molybdenum cofactor cytidylyltransferase